MTNSVRQNVRQHALSMLTDLFLDSNGGLVPTQYLCPVLSEICIPLAGRCIVRLQSGNRNAGNSDSLLIEFELCIGLVFKPLRHHLQTVIEKETGNNLSLIWGSVLTVLESLLGERSAKDSPESQPVPVPTSMKATMTSLANEHLQSAIMVLISAGVLRADSRSPDDITTMTWESVGRMGIQESAVQEWKEAAAQV